MSSLVQIEPATALDSMAQIFATKQLHHDVGDVVFGESRIENLDDMSALYCTCCLSLAFKTRDIMRVLRKFGIDELHGNTFANAGVEPFVHHAHPTPTDRSDNFVLVNPAANK